MVLEVDSQISMQGFSLLWTKNKCRMILMSIYFQLNWSILFNFIGILCLLQFILLQSEAIIVISFYDFVQSEILHVQV